MINENISLEINTIPDENNNLNNLNNVNNSIIDISNYVNEFIDNKITLDDQICLEIDYNVNYNIKQLLLITDYYGLNKTIKAKQLKKDELIQVIILFETDPINKIITQKRKKLWFYINELKKDNIMKKYILM